MKTILVPVNFSPCSHNAALYAADLAQALKSDLHLIHVIDFPFTTSEVTMTNSIYTEMVQSASDSLKELQVELTRHTQGRVRLEINLQVGGLTARVQDLCQKLEPCAVVLGTSGPTLEKFLAGSPVPSILRLLRVPVIAVPEKAVFHRYERVLLACDPDDLESGLPQYLPLLKEWRDHFGSRFDVVTVDTSRSGSGQPAENYRYQWQDLPAYIHLIHASHVEEGIQQYLGDHEIDLVLVFPKRHTLLDFHISQSRKLTRSSTVPIMSLHE